MKKYSKIFLIVLIFMLMFIGLSDIKADNSGGGSFSGGGRDFSDTSSGTITSCRGIADEETCKHNDKFSCVWNETKYGNYCNTDNLTYVQCGDAFDIPSEVPPLINFAVNLLKIATPIVLIMVGMITLVKALTAAKEDEITKAKNSLIKKVIAAAMVFFVVSIVQFVISLVAEDSVESNNFSDCLDCFLNNDCETTMYYKTNIAGTYMCTYFETGEMKACKGNK